MAELERYEDLVLGSGAGGKLLAWHLAQSGAGRQSSSAVDRRLLPQHRLPAARTKCGAPRSGASTASGARFGAGRGCFAVDMQVWQRKRDMVDGLICRARGRSRAVRS